MQLVPGSLRRPAMAPLAACVAAMAVTGIRFAGYGLPGWLDAAFGPRIEAHLGRFPVLVNWLPDVGTLEPVAAMTLALILACAVTRRWRGAVLAVAAVPGGVRLLLVLMAVLLAVGVASAMVASGAHSFTDAVAGAAVGTGVVLACALILDALGSLLRSGPAAPPPPAG